MIGCVVNGLIFTSKNYRRNCIAYVYISIISIGIMILGLEINKSWILFSGSAIFGANIYPFVTIMMDFAS
jgi:hypothetical protein